MKNLDNLFSEKLPHESAEKHVSGLAKYTDDILEPTNTLYAAIGWSTVAKGSIVKIDLRDVIKSAGVCGVITERDIPGINDVGPVFKGDVIFSSKKIKYFGQPIFAVAADTTELARKAVLKAKIQYKKERPIIRIKEALEKKSYILKTRKFSNGNARKAIKNSQHKLIGESQTGGQDHLYLEGQVALAIPKEDNGLLIYSSTQHPSKTQQIVAKVLNQNFNTIDVHVRRIGGGFGGKETQSFMFAAISSLLAKKFNKPVKLRLDRDEDMILTGKRHDFYFKYEVGFSDNGKINGLDIILASRCGHSADLSEAINDRAIYNIDNAYYIPNVKLVSYRCKTNTVSNTAFRGFGAPQASFCIENIIDNISNFLKVDAYKIRYLNLYQKNNITHFGMKIKDNVINDIFNKLINSSNYKKRRKEIEEFNQSNEYIKKGLAITPAKFGISFTTTHLNQGGALVHIYTDGSIHLNHGGVEMGQGLMTKIAQITANSFGIKINNIKITSTNTEKVANTSASAASASTDINGAAVLNAINKIKDNLFSFIQNHFKFNGKIIKYKNNNIYFGKNKITFKKLINLAYLNRIPLSSSGFYKTPKIHVDKSTLKGRPFLYFCYGAAVSEVMIDTLTGENKLLKVDILQDVGNSINPSIDIGQIEGGFVQGLGWLTSEEVSWGNDGKILTFSPSTYKIPVMNDIPKNFNVKIYNKGINNENTINKSKAVGEPPLLLAISTYFAIKNAISYAKKNNKINLTAPATPENILNSINK
jgi:xanthine dehydrogenase large subunit